MATALRQSPPAPAPAAPTSAAAERDPLAVEARRRLRRSGYSALKRVTCEAEGGTLRLRGRLPSYYLKQVSQAIVTEIADVKRIVNQIVVAAAGSSPGARRARFGRTGSDDPGAGSSR